MPQVTVITDEACRVEATIDGDRVLIDPSDLPGALGWELKPEGLCHGAVCVPVSDQASLVAGDRVDLAAAAAALGRPSVIDVGCGIMAVSLASEQRREALDALVAPPFRLPDLDGEFHDLSDWRGQKRLLFAFASW